MNQPPRITVIALCYNHEDYLVECLDSIRNQTCQDFELIVTDDCSRDGSADLIADWLARHRPEARFIRHTKNAGICATLNEAVRCANGTCISMIATDDAWEPFKLERQLARFEAAGEETAVVYSDAIRISKTGERLAGDFIESHRPGFAPPSGRIFGAVADGNFIPAMATLIRTSALRAVGLYDERLTHEDFDMWLRLSARYDFVFEPGTVARYRILENSLIRTLLRAPTPAQSFTEFLMARKLLEAGGLTAAQKKRWVERLWNAAYALYVLDDERSTSAMWAAYRHTGNVRTALLALARGFGITRPRMHRVARLLSGRTGA